MKDALKEWLRANAKGILTIGISVLFIIGAIFFGKTVWNVGYETVWGKWLALIVGEIVYLYIFSFLLFGVEIILNDEIGWFGELFVVLVCSFIISLYLGVILKSTEFLGAAAVFFIIIGVIIFIAVRKQHR